MNSKYSYVICIHSNESVDVSEKLLVKCIFKVNDLTIYNLTKNITKPLYASVVCEK